MTFDAEDLDAVPSALDTQAYSRHALASHVKTAVPVFGPNDTVDQILGRMRQKRFDSASLIAICEDKQLVGAVRMEDLLAAPGDLPVEELMDPQPPVAHPDDDQEVAAWRAVQRGDSAVPVTSPEGRFLGLVPPSALVEVLLHEHEHDMSRLGGFLHNTAATRRTSSEPIPRRYWHRLPWLLLGLAGAAVAAVITSFFEEDLRNNLVLALFLPGIVYLADAVGTQTETIVIRGLSVGVPISRVARSELVTGLLVGLTISICFIPVAALFGNLALAVTVALALFAAVCTATTVAMSLPYLLTRMGKDPAFGSGPLATVIQDLLSITIYFLIASWLVD